MKKTLFCICYLMGMSSVLIAQTVLKDSLELDKGVYDTPAQLLKGKIAGVRVSSTDNNPNGFINTNIRGINSVRGTNEPLWIIDGAILSSSAGENLNAFWQNIYAAQGYDFSAPLAQMSGINLYDIESIEVLKDASATALYGARGANGVIVVKTKTPSKEKYSIEWNSNLGIETTSAGGFKPSFSHNHNIAIGAYEGRVAYRLSAFIRDTKNAVPGVGNTSGGLRMYFNNRSNGIIQFGMNSSLSFSRLDSQFGTTNFGEPSLMTALRGLVLPNGKINDVDGYLEQYQDQLRNFRTTTSFYLNLNFTPAFHFNNTASIDYQTNSRYIWYGPGTAFGDEFENASGISINSLLYADYKPELKYERIFANKHQVSLTAGAEVIYSANKFNTMNGTKIFISDFKARGFGFRESQDNSAYFSQNKYELGFFASANYDFKHVAGIRLSYRADRNPRYEDKFTSYPSVDTYFDIREAFFNSQSGVSSLKLRAGYGHAGYGRYIPYQLYSTLTGGEYPVHTEQEAVFFEGYNKLNTKGTHITLESGFLNNRLSTVITFYDRKTSDNLSLYCFGHKHANGILWVEAPRSSVCEQTSEISNTGFEIDLNAALIRKNKFKWDLNINSAFNNGVINRVDDQDKNGYKLNADGLVVNHNVEGKPIGALLSESFNAVPKVYGGLGTTLAFGALSLDLLSDYTFGNNILNMNAMISDGVITPSDKYIESGDFFRLSRVSLQYVIPMKKVSWIKSIGVNLTGTNIFTITNPHCSLTPF